MKVNDIQAGMALELVVVDNLTRTQIVQYAGASGDLNPLHTDEVYATVIANQPSVMAHGMLTMGATARALTDWFGAGQLLTYGVRFAGPVWPGDCLTVLATVERVRAEGIQPTAELSLRTVTQDGRVVLTGTATAKLQPDI